MLLHEEVKPSHGYFFMDDVRVSRQFEGWLESDGGNGINGVDESGLHLNLEVRCPLCDISGYLIVVQPRGIRQAVCGSIRPLCCDCSRNG